MAWDGDLGAAPTRLIALSVRGLGSPCTEYERRGDRADRNSAERPFPRVQAERGLVLSISPGIKVVQINSTGLALLLALEGKNEDSYRGLGM